MITIMSDDRPEHFWGIHALIDCKAGDKSKITDGTNIKNFAKALVKAIDMKAYGDPIAEHFATHDPSKGGYSLVQLIETSNITGHFVDENGDFYIDIFSCKTFDANEAVKCIDKFFGPEVVNCRVVYRNAPDRG